MYALNNNISCLNNQIQNYNSAIEQQNKLLYFRNIIISMTGSLSNIYSYRDHIGNNIIQRYLEIHGTENFYEFFDFVNSIEGTIRPQWFDNINSRREDLYDMMRSRRVKNHDHYKNYSITKQRKDNDEKIKREKDLENYTRNKKSKIEKFNEDIDNLLGKSKQYSWIGKKDFYGETALNSYNREKYQSLLEMNEDIYEIMKIKNKRLLNVYFLNMLIKMNDDYSIELWLNRNLYRNNKIISKLTFDERKDFKLDSCLGKCFDGKTIFEIFIDSNLQKFAQQMINYNAVWITPETLNSFKRVRDKCTESMQLFIRNKIIGYYIRYVFRTHNRNSYYDFETLVSQY